MPDKPKRPMTAFLLWLQSHRSQIKAQHPGISTTQIARKGGEMWRTMVDKKVWEEKAQRLREQYRHQLAEYNAQQKEDSSPRKRRRFTRARSLSSSDDYSD